jgi:hypothetical protein
MASGRERTLSGELLALSTLCAASIPVSAAARVPFYVAVLCGAVWAAAFGVGSLSVRAIIDQRRRPELVTLARTASGVGLLFGLTWAAHSRFVPFAVACAGPFLASVTPLSPRKLRYLGWALVIGDLAVLVTLAVRFSTLSTS